jgi:sulfur relay (sulfurtransferase) DsrC/TusE family protein
MKYSCENCGKTFDKEEQALACESAHKEKELAAEKLAKEKQARIKEITDAQKRVTEMINKYYADYKCSLPLSIDEGGNRDFIRWLFW